MRTVCPVKLLAGAFLALAMLGPAPAGAATSGRSCDRACLEGLVDGYLKALAARDPKKAPSARTVRFIENNQALRLGEGTWKTVDGLGKYRHLFSDPQGGRVAAITTVRENGVPAILDLVLTVQDRRIAEVETLIIRDARGAERYEALGAPEPLWLQPVPPEQRVPRATVAASIDKYFSGMQRNDPKGDYSFFDPDCNRLEHAEKTTNQPRGEAYGHSTDLDFRTQTCQQQFQSGFLGFVTELRDRRILVIDEERQAGFALVDLDHNGTVRVLHLSTGKDFVLPDYFDVPRTLRVGEGFRLRGEKLHRIEMTLTELPYGMRPPAAEPARPAEPARTACERDCLTEVLGQVLQAMVDHDPKAPVLAPGVRYTENGQKLTPGDGLWGTATSIAIPGDGLAALGRVSSAYKLVVADPQTGQVGYLGAVNENGTPGMLAVRIRVVAGRAADIEAVVVRQEETGERSGTVALFAPQPLTPMNPRGFTEPEPIMTAVDRGTRNGVAGAAIRYMDGMAKGTSNGVPLAQTCVRRDNGGQITGNGAAAPIDPKAPGFKPFALSCAAQLDSGFFKYLSAVRERRVLAVDEERGLVLVLALLDHDGTVRGLDTAQGRVGLPANLLTPSTDIWAAVFKVKGGRVERIEAITKPVPYAMPGGWSK